MSGRLSLFQAKARTAETYLAGIGASGALMASAFVLFIVLVGVVTFNAWPHPGQLIAGSGGNVSLKDVTLINQQPQPAPTPNLVALLGGPATVAATPASNRGGGGGADATRHSRVVGIGSGLGTSSPGGGSGTGTGGGSSTPPQTTTVAPSLPRAGGLGQVVAGVGNNLQSDTNSLGNSLGGSNSALGGLVQGLGTTLNNQLQQLGGTR